jgi:hypothetical protein
MLAAGVKINADKVIPIIIDPDIANADLTRTVEILNDYNKIHDCITFPAGSQNNFFRTEIQKDNAKDYTLEFQNTNAISFETFLNLDELSREDQAMTKMLFSEKNLASNMNVGFKGNPNIGSVVLNQILDSDGFAKFANDFSQGDRIFIVSSIFGGTGAAGFPMLANALKYSDRFTAADLIKKSYKGAITILPYFKVEGKESDDHEIKSSTFISKTKSALSYYEKNIVDNNLIDELYYLADIPGKAYDYSEGGSTQKNDAHMIEFLAASAIIEFMSHDGRNSNGSSKLENYELGVQKSNDSLNFTNFYDGLHDMLYRPLTQFVLMGNAIKNDYSYIKNNLVATKAMNGFYDSDFMRRYLKPFMEKYEGWLKELAENDPSLLLYNLDCGRKPFGVVNGVDEKHVFTFSRQKDYEFFEGRLNSEGDKAKKVVKDSDPSYFLEMFYRATNRLIDEKLNN